MKPLIDSKEAAVLLGICTRKLWELTNRGEVPHVRIGRSVRFDPAALEKWVQAHTSGKRRS
jgi:excisionase family DNA binding protein